MPMLRNKQKVQQPKDSEYHHKGKFWYAVTCNADNAFDDGLTHKEQYGCGRVPLTVKEYERQMMNIDNLWQCPICRGSAEFSGDCENV